MTADYWTRHPERARAWVLGLLYDEDPQPFTCFRDERGFVVRQEFPDPPPPRRGVDR